MKLSKSDKAKQEHLYAKMVSVPEKMLPRLELSAKDLPAIKGWDVGNTYNIQLKVKQISKSEGGYDGNQPLRASFEVVNAKPYEEDNAS